MFVYYDLVASAHNHTVGIFSPTVFFFFAFFRVQTVFKGWSMEHNKVKIKNKS